MKISATMSLADLAERMGDVATEADARAMRDLLVERFDGQDTAEVYNDLDGDIVNFFRVLRDPETRAARRAGSSPARGTSEHWRGFRAGSPPSGKRNGEMICPHDAPGAGHEIVRNSA